MPHGSSAVIIARDYYEITDKDILNAIENHSTGDGSHEMTKIAKLLFFIDKTDPSKMLTNILNEKQTDGKIDTNMFNSDFDYAFNTVLILRILDRYYKENRFMPIGEINKLVDTYLTQNKFTN